MGERCSYQPKSNDFGYHAVGLHAGFEMSSKSNHLRPCALSARKPAERIPYSVYVFAIWPTEGFNGDADVRRVAKPDRASELGPALVWTTPCTIIKEITPFI